jgi:hypothetical protein
MKKMINMEIRDPYKGNCIRSYNELNNYFVPELELRYSKNPKSKDSKIPEVTEEYNSYRVWLLFAKFEDWVCVQVAHSKTDVKEEIEFVLKCLPQKWNRNDCELKLKDSQFYKCVCPVPDKGEDYRDLLYRKIGNESTEFIICVLDVDKYLGLEKNAEPNKNDAERIIEICKNQYAEAKIAYQTLAVYWRKVSSAIDGQTISYAVEHESEFK